MSTAAMHVAKTGLTAQQTKMQIIANNLANVNTTGFKSDRPNFESLLYQVTQSAGGQTADGTMLTSASAVGTGVKLLNTQKLYTQGGLLSTDNSLDLAIDGAGFFQVLMPDGQMGYTRNGTFSRNGQGTLTTSSGYVVQPEIQIPEGTNEINVSSDGIISVMLAGQSDPQRDRGDHRHPGGELCGNHIGERFGGKDQSDHLPPDRRSCWRCDCALFCRG